MSSQRYVTDKIPSWFGAVRTWVLGLSSLQSSPTDPLVLLHVILPVVVAATLATPLPALQSLLPVHTHLLEPGKRKVRDI